MSELEYKPVSSDSEPSASEMDARAARKGGRRLFLTAAAVAGLALTGAAATQALSQDGPPWRDGGFMGRPFGDGPVDPAVAADRADRMVRHLAIEIDANTEQQDKLRAITKVAVNDLLPLREKAQAARERARGLLTAATIDRAAIESFRAQQMALADEASRRIAKALADAAEVLTPDQRRQLAERAASRRSHWRPWHRG